jgi:ADP-heptose:LPS heptosyltransferase
MSAVFHTFYVLGTLVRRLNLKLYGFQALPTLVIRTDGIGDALLFEPALESVARTVSPSEVHVWAPAGTCQLFAECPSITRRLTIPRGCRPGNLQYFMSFWWHAKIGFELGRWIFERVIYPVESPEPLGNWLFLSARATDRWINWGDLHNQFDWQQARTHEAATRVIENRPGDAHEFLRNEYLTDQWAEEPRLRRPRVQVGQRATEQAGRTLFDWRRAVQRMGGRDIIGLVVGGTSRVNHYPAQQWAEALKRLWDEDRVVAVLLGGPSDRAALDELEALLRDVPHLRLSRPVHLLTVAAIIRRLDAMLTVDTGLAHVSLAMRVPTVVLVGGGHPGRFFPWPNTRDQVVLNVAMPCNGCQNRCQLAEAECVTKIPPSDIVEAYARLRQRSAPMEPTVVAAQAPAYHVKVAG